MTLNEISGQIVDAAIAVHKVLGPGLLESAYQACLTFELRSRGLRVDDQLPLPVVYRDQRLDVGYRLDLVVEHQVIAEVKSIEARADSHGAVAHIPEARRQAAGSAAQLQRSSDDRWDQATGA